MGNSADAAGALASAGREGMIPGMTSAKVAISLPKEVLARARAAVKRGEAASLSAYVSKAIEEKTSDDDVLKMLDEMLEETGGPMTAEEKHWADGVLGITEPKRKPRRRK
jgi:antitoxin ParD1/3/4